MDKQYDEKRGYVLGKKDGYYVYLAKESFDCNWYWGYGYVQTWEHSRPTSDIHSHQHFDSLFLNNGAFTKGFVEYFDDTPLIEKEIWTLLELMKSFYVARRYSDMLHSRGAHITTNPAKDVIGSQEEYDRINKVVIPRICEEVGKLLSPVEV